MGQILVDRGCFAEKSLTSFLVKLCNIPHLNLLEYLLDRDLFQCIPMEVCVEHYVIPIYKLGKNLTVEMVDPLNMEVRKKIRELCPELRIKPILCACSHYKKVIEELLGSEGEGRGGTQEMDSAGRGSFPPEPIATEGFAEELAPGKGVVKTFDMAPIEEAPSKARPTLSRALIRSKKNAKSCGAMWAASTPDKFVLRIEFGESCRDSRVGHDVET